VSVRTAIAAVMTSLVAVLALASYAAAFEGGGRKPSEAPTIAWGQHNTGQLNNHEEDANYNPGSSEGKEVALWRLPSVSSHDQIVVNWHGLPRTHGSGFPVCMMLAQGITDFNWGAVFDGGRCYSPAGYELSGSGTAATPITIQATDTGNTYLEFWAYANRTPSSNEQETFPYDFSVEPPRHYLNVNLSSFSEIPANGVVHASVTGATGLPAPDGLIYTLTVRWREGGIAVYTAPSAGGQIAFQMALPESALKKNAGFIVSRPADGEYQAVESPAVHGKVTEIVAPSASSTCKKATAYAHVLARQLRRLKRDARSARGFTRRRLRREAHLVSHHLRNARRRAATACGTA
jgi:hypothetical protein